MKNSIGLVLMALLFAGTNSAIGKLSNDADSFVSKTQNLDSGSVGEAQFSLWKVYWDEGVSLSQQGKYKDAIEVLKNALSDLRQRVDTTDRTAKTKSLIEDCLLKAGMIDEYVAFVRKEYGRCSWEILYSSGNKLIVKNSVDDGLKLFAISLDDLERDKTIDSNLKLIKLREMKARFDKIGDEKLIRRVDSFLKAYDLDSYTTDDGIAQYSSDHYKQLLNGVKSVDRYTVLSRLPEARRLCLHLIESIQSKNDLNIGELDIYIRLLDRLTRLSIGTDEANPLQSILKGALNRLTNRKITGISGIDDELYNAIILSDLGLCNLTLGKKAVAGALLKRAKTVMEKSIDNKTHPRRILLLVDLARLSKANDNMEEAKKLVEEAANLAKNNPRIGALASEKFSITMLNYQEKLQPSKPSAWLANSESSWRGEKSKQIPGLDDYSTMVLAKTPLTDPPKVITKVPPKAYQDWLTTNHPNSKSELAGEKLASVAGALSNTAKLFEIPYQKISLTDLHEAGLGGYRLAAIDSDIPEYSIERIRNFVRSGGYLISCGESISVLRRAFPGAIYQGYGSTPLGVSDAVYVDRKSPLSKGLPKVAFWHNDETGQLIQPGFPGKFRVLVRSRTLSKIDNSRLGILAVLFKEGDGFVLHLINNIDTNNIGDPTPDIGVSLRQALIANFALAALKRSTDGL